MSTGRMKEISSELRDLCAELEKLQSKALPLVEELDNWELANGFKFPWRPKVHDNFLILQRLITRV